MKETLIPYLICPICSKKFSVKSIEKRSYEILTGNLICLKNHKFPIKDGIPRFVVDKSKIFVKTENSFSSKWKNYNKTYHSKKWFNGQKKWFLERFGWKTIKQLGLPSASSPSGRICVDINGENIFDETENAKQFNDFYSELAEELVEKLPEASDKYTTDSARVL